MSNNNFQKLHKPGILRAVELYGTAYGKFASRLAKDSNEDNGVIIEVDDLDIKDIIKSENSEELLKKISEIEPVLSALAEAEMQYNLSSIGKIHTIPSALRSLLGLPVKATTEPGHLLSVSAKKDALEKDVYEVEDMQLNVSAGIVLALYAARTGYTGDDSYTITTFRGQINLKEKLPREFIDLIQEYRNEIDSSTLFKEFIFGVIHEMLHVRLNHLTAMSIFQKEHKFSPTLSNIVLDLYINTLILTFDKYLASVPPKANWTASGIYNGFSVKSFLESVAGKTTKEEYAKRLEYAYSSIPLYRTSIRMHLPESIEKEELEERRAVWSEILPAYGVDDVDVNKLTFGTSVDNLVIDRLYDRSDDELISIISTMFGPLFDVIDEITNEAADETLNALGISPQDLVDIYDTPMFLLVMEVLNQKYREIFKNKMADRIKQKKSLKKLVIDAVTTIGLPNPTFPIGTGTGAGSNVAGKAKGESDTSANKSCSGNYPDSEASAKAEASRGEQTIRELMNEHEKDVKEATGKQAGTVPGFVRKLTVRKSKPPSFIELMRKLGEKGGVGGYTPTFAPPNRKFMGNGVSRNLLHPSYVTKRPNIAVIVDTSGSMNEGELGKFIGAIKHVMRAFPQATFSFYWNDADYQVTKYRGNQFSKFEQDIKKRGVHGGGGSVFDNVLNDRTIIRNHHMLVFVSDFYIFAEPGEAITRRLPTIFIPTKAYDSSVLNKFTKYFKHSMVMTIEDL